MKYLVLSWDSLDLKKFRREGEFEEGEEDTAWALAAKCWQNPRVRLAIVIAIPKVSKSLEQRIREDAQMPQRFTIPTKLTGNTKPIAENHGWGD